MKEKIAKRSVAATSALALAATLQWVSGMPFERSPQEAGFLLFAIVLAGFAATYPGFDV